MATGQATVVNQSGNSVQNQVRDATGSAVHAAQNSGASKKEVIQARDAAKADVLTKNLSAVASGKDSSGQIRAEFENNPGLVQDAMRAGLIDKNGVIASKVANYGSNITYSRTAPAQTQSQTVQAAFEKKQPPRSFDELGHYLADAASEEIEKRPKLKSAIDKMDADLYKIPIIKKTVDKYETPEEIANMYSGLTGKALYTVFPTLKIAGPKNPTQSSKKLVDGLLQGYYGGSDETGDLIASKGNVATRGLDATAEWVSNKGAWLNKGGAPGRFIRGATFDNAAGLVVIGSEGYKTAVAANSASFGDLKKGDLKTVNQKQADIYAHKVGNLLGGTVYAAKEDPAAFLGSLVGFSLAKASVKAGGAKAVGIIDTAGRTSTPLKTFTEPKIANAGADIFRKGSPNSIKLPLVKDITVPDAISRFGKTKGTYPNPSVFPDKSTAGIHTSPTNLGKTFKVMEGTSSEPGLFVADKASPYFAKLPEVSVKGIGFSNPVKGFLSTIKSAKNAPSRFMDIARGRGGPTINFVGTSGVRRLPKGIRSNRKASTDFIKKGADSDFFHTTTKLEQNLAGGYLAEIEAVSPPKTAFKSIDGSYYTKLKQPVSILGFKIDPSVKVPINAYFLDKAVKTADAKQTKLRKTTNGKKAKQLTPKKSPSYKNSYSGGRSSGSEPAIIDLTYSLKGRSSSKSGGRSSSTASRSSYKNSHSATYYSGISVKEPSYYASPYRGPYKTVPMSTKSPIMKPVAKSKERPAKLPEYFGTRKRKAREKRDINKQFRINDLSELRL